MEFNVFGMSCAACSARVEKAVSSLEDVSECSVSLLTNSMHVEGNAEPKKIIEAVEKAGYNATEKNGSTVKNNPASKEIGISTEIKSFKARLTASVTILVFLMYVSMGHVMWGAPLPHFLSSNPVSIGITELLLSSAVMIINQRFFINGVKGALNLAPNMDTLVALGSASAFLYSVYALFMMSDAQLAGNTLEAHKYLHELYFEAAAMILALITVGKALEARAKGKTADALSSLMALAPDKATVLRDGKEIVISADEINVGDIFILKPGDRAAADGVVIEGTSSVDESALTGESVPVDKEVGDRVSAATVNCFGYLKCRTVKVGEDTTLSQIIKTVSDAQATKAPIAKLADKVSGIFVPTILGISVVVFIIWLLFDKGIGFAVARAVSVLVISCPCALGLATPVAIMVGSGLGARHGVLFKNATALEQTGRAKTVVLDKTGTITQGKPKVTDVFPFAGYTETELLSFAYALEKYSGHPLATAVTEYSESRAETDIAVSEFSTENGKGVCANVEFKEKSDKGYAGNIAYISSVAEASEAIKKQLEELSAQGKTPMLFAFSGEIIGIIAVADVVKEDSKSAVAELKAMGIEVVMLTGDNERTAKAIAENVGIERVVADVLPDEKMGVIEGLKKETNERIIMIGDGINDAPALVAADVGIAIGAGTDVAIDSADAVLVKSSLADAVKAVKIGRATLKNIRENLFWAFFYNIIGIPIAAGVFVYFGLTLNPMIGALAMSLSSFCVVTNALRLNFTKLSSEDLSKIKTKATEKEKKEMETLIKVEGMMCKHCENRVKSCLEAIDGVTEAEVSCEKGEALVKHSVDIPFETFKNAVTSQGYEVK